MTINQDSLNKLFNLKTESTKIQQELNERVEIILEEMKEIYEELDYADDEEYSQRNIDFDRVVNVTCNKEEVTVKTELVRYCSCCSNEIHYYHFPVHYLFDNNWKDELKRKIEEEKLKEKQQEEAKLLELKRFQEEQERKQWKCLNKKYGKTMKEGKQND